MVITRPLKTSIMAFRVCNEVRSWPTEIIGYRPTISTANTTHSQDMGLKCPKLLPLMDSGRYCAGCSRGVCQIGERLPHLKVQLMVDRRHVLKQISIAMDMAVIVS